MTTPQEVASIRDLQQFLEGIQGDQPLVPVIGTGAPHALGASRTTFPTMTAISLALSGAIDSLGLTPQQAADARVFLQHGDPISLFTLLGLASEGTGAPARAKVRSLFPVPAAVARDEDLTRGYEMFASGDWRLVIATDIDGYVESIFRDEWHRSYDTLASDAGVVCQRLVEQVREPLVVRILGQWRDVFAPALLAWPDLQRHLALPSDFLEWIASTEGLLAPEYGASLQRLAVTSAPAAPVKTSGSGWFLDLLETLSGRSRLILIGVGRLEPLALALRYLSEKRGTVELSRIASISANEPPRAPAGVSHLTFDLATRPTDLFSAILALADAASRNTAGGQGQERQSRRDGYRELAVRYDWRSSNPPACWLGEAVAAGGDLLPFVEFWANNSRRHCVDAVRIFVPSACRYRPEPDLEKIVHSYWSYSQTLRAGKAKPEPLDDELKVRVNRWQAADDRLDIEVEPIRYRWYLGTNHFVANVTDQHVNAIQSRGFPELADSLRRFHEDRTTLSRIDPRARLCGDVESIRLRTEASCANHVGISGMLVGEYLTPDGTRLPVIICPPSGNQVSSPMEVIPPVSGSMDWPEALEQPSGRAQSVDGSVLEVNLLREFYEECLADGRKLRAGDERSAERVVTDARALLERLELVNFCQNIERGGKPEFVFLMSLRVSANHFLESMFRPNWELKHTWWDVDEASVWAGRFNAAARRVILLPSPLDTSLNLHGDSERAIAVLRRITGNIQYNPVLRAGLAAVLRWADFAASSS